MKPENHKENKPALKKRRGIGLPLAIIAVLLVIGILFFIMTKEGDNTGSPGQQHSIWRRITESITGTSNQTQEQTGSNQKASPGDKSTSQPNGQTQIQQDKTNASSPVESQQPKASDNAQQNQQSESRPSKADSLQSILSGPSNSCRAASEKVNAFYSHLDAQPYIKAFHLGETSKVYFTELIQNLLDNPPVISRETDDLFTVLKNTAHFYRVIGKNNITILKTILEKEKPYIENTLADYYVLTQYPGCLQKSFSLRIPDYSIYDYAGFFLNTMGGRLYLFRRDSVSRMTVSYYGILVIDKANRKSNNKDGIQIKQPINSLITEIENSGNQLLLKEKYLDKLYELKERYQ